MRAILLLTVTLTLIAWSFTTSALADESAEMSVLLQPAEWGGSYGGTPDNSGSGYGGQQGGQQGGGWSGQQQQQPQSGYGGQQQKQGGGNGRPQGQEQQQGGNGGQSQQGGSGAQQQQGGSGGPPQSGGSPQTGNAADKTACLASCNKQCMSDFVPGSTKEKTCSGRCVRTCR